MSKQTLKTMPLLEVLQKEVPLADFGRGRGFAARASHGTNGYFVWIPDNGKPWCSCPAATICKHIRAAVDALAQNDPARDRI